MTVPITVLNAQEAKLHEKSVRRQSSAHKAVSMDRNAASSGWFFMGALSGNSASNDRIVDAIDGIDPDDKEFIAFVLFLLTTLDHTKQEAAAREISSFARHARNGHRRRASDRRALLEALSTLCVTEDQTTPSDSVAAILKTLGIPDGAGEVRTPRKRACQ